jgi:hypothetical protein
MKSLNHVKTLSPVVRLLPCILAEALQKHQGPLARPLSGVSTSSEPGRGATDPRHPIL